MFKVPAKVTNVEDKRETVKFLCVNEIFIIFKKEMGSVSSYPCIKRNLISCVSRIPGIRNTTQTPIIIELTIAVKTNELLSPYLRIKNGIIFSINKTIPGKMKAKALARLLSNSSRKWFANPPSKCCRNIDKNVPKMQEFIRRYQKRSQGLVLASTLGGV
jgi:hypothetical protein